MPSNFKSTIACMMFFKVIECLGNSWIACHQPVLGLCKAGLWRPAPMGSKSIFSAAQDNVRPRRTISQKLAKSFFNATIRIALEWPIWFRGRENRGLNRLADWRKDPAKRLFFFERRAMPEIPEHVHAGSLVSDHSLMRRLRLGSEDAATQIYLRYVHRLRALARARSSPDLARCVDAEEIVQSVFGSFFRRAKSGYYDVPEGEELWRLFLVIALNKIRAKGSFYRAAKRNVRITSDGAVLEKCLESAHDEDEEALRDLRMWIEEANRAIDYRAAHDMVVLRIEGYQVAENRRADEAIEAHGGTDSSKKCRKEAENLSTTRLNVRFAADTSVEFDLDRYIAAFEDAKKRRSSRRSSPVLPDHDDPLYLNVLREVVRVDLRSLGPMETAEHLHDYRRRFPGAFRRCRKLTGHLLRRLSFAAAGGRKRFDR